jgi:hypothetical protein
MNRTEHKFHFPADKIAASAKGEAEYHEDRVKHWQDRQAAALETVESTIGAKLVQQEVTGGMQFSVIIDYGDQEAYRELNLATQKIQTHRSLAERFRSDQALYGSQSGVSYELDADDVAHFRLGGAKRED